MAFSEGHFWTSLAAAPADVGWYGKYLHLLKTMESIPS